MAPSYFVVAILLCSQILAVTLVSSVIISNRNDGQNTENKTQVVNQNFSYIYKLTSTHKEIINFPFNQTAIFFLDV